MIRNRRPDWRRIKSKLSYTIEEVARTLGTHRNTVRHWVRQAGFSAMTETRPHLILGSDLVAFLRARRALGKRKCGAGEIYCLRCRVPRRPVPGLLEYRPLTSKRGRIVAFAPRARQSYTASFQFTELQMLRPNSTCKSKSPTRA